MKRSQIPNLKFAALPFSALLACGGKAVPALRLLGVIRI